VVFIIVVALSGKKTINKLTLNYLTFQFFDFERLCFYDYHWVDTSAGGLLVAEGIIRPIFSASALT
jgi:hypothetical protein